MICIGIDPGKKGGIAALDQGARVHALFSFEGKTERDIESFLSQFFDTRCFALLEDVHSTPQMGVTSAFTFGRGYGFLRGLLTGRISFDDVRPQTWQTALGGLKRKPKETQRQHKLKLRQRAESLYSRTEVTEAVADALLIAHYLLYKYDK